MAKTIIDSNKVTVKYSTTYAILTISKTYYPKIKSLTGKHLQMTVLSKFRMRR